MASSTADKRWAPHSRKSGMTVLGKIPKPINLPSQKLENHGLDPNVEIVPKGTITWGKPTSAPTNAWGTTSVLSPKNDGASTSPSHTNGRPTSGGGTRPSTSGSDKSLDSATAWGANSRPLTASGILPSQNFTIANRPRSAETRPGSSPLSRFAEGSVENTRAATRNLEKLGPTSHEFNLSSRDFPTLGSEKNSELEVQRAHSSHGRPTSSSGKEVAPIELGKSHIAGVGEVFGSSDYQNVKPVNSEYSYDAAAPLRTSNLQTDQQQPHPYPNLHMPPPQFESWHALPSHPHEGMWHRGMAPYGPHRPLGPPGGGFPVDNFAYYPQFRPNTEAAPRLGAGQGGYHPHMNPNSYIGNQPVIPVRPVYPGPMRPMPYDGYHGPPRGSFTPGERGIPFMGVPGLPGNLHPYPNQNDMRNSGESHGRPGRYNTVTPREQQDSDQVHVANREQHRILLDHQDLWADDPEAMSNVQPGQPSQTHRDAHITEVTIKGKKHPFTENSVIVKSAHDQKAFSGTGSRAYSYDSEKAPLHPRENVEGILRRPKEDFPHVVDHPPVIKKNVALIEKIEGLNNKARNVDSHNMVEPFSSRVDKAKLLKTADTKADNITNDLLKAVGRKADNIANDIHSTIATSENAPAIESQSSEAGKAEKLGETDQSHPQRRGNASRNRQDAPAKERTNNNFAGHGWRENSTSDSTPMVHDTNAQDYQASHDIASQAITEETDLSSSDSVDHDEQRAKMREIAAQRAKQLLQEEEERTRQQRAKALAKLEELNRRTQSQNNLSDPAPVVVGDSHKSPDPEVSTSANFDVSTGKLSVDTQSVDPVASSPPNDSEVKNIAFPVEVPSTTLQEALTKDNVYHHGSLSSKAQDINTTVSDVQKTDLQSSDSNIAKNKQGNYRKRQVISHEKNSSEKSFTAGITENVKNGVEANAGPLNTDSVAHDDPSAQNKRGNRHTRNKKKSDAPVSVAAQPVVTNEENPEKNSDSRPKSQTKAAIADSDVVPVQTQIIKVGSITVVGEGSLIPSNQGWPTVTEGPLSTVTEDVHATVTTEDAHVSANNRPKLHQHRRAAKHQHGARSVEKLHGNESAIWAPVQQVIKNEQPEETGFNSLMAVSTRSTAKSSSEQENVTRTKRAEMERYVPKPLSKELLQNSGQNLIANTQASSTGLSGKSNLYLKSHEKETLDNSSVTETEIGANPKKWEDKRFTRHGKPHSSWRKSNANESTEYADYSHETKSDQQPSDQLQPVQHDSQTEKQIKASGWEHAENSSPQAQPVTMPVAANDHSVANRRRQNAKPQRADGGDYALNDNKDREAATDVSYQTQSPAMDSSHSDMRNARTGNRNIGAVGYSRAHWKPKSNAQWQSTSQITSGNQGKDVDSRGSQSNMDVSSHKNSGQRQKDGKSHKGKGEMKYEEDNSMGQSNIPKQDAPVLDHENSEHLHNAAPRRQNYARYNRGKEAIYRGRGHDAGKQNLGPNGDKRRGSGHFEYQPVGSYNRPTDFYQQNPNLEEPIEVPPVSRPMYREPVQNRPHPTDHFARRGSVSGGGSTSPMNSYTDE